MDVLTLGDYANPALWGEGRVELMNRVTIALNIPRLEGHLPDVRLVVAMANGALVVSEPLYLPEPYVPGVHYVEAPVEQLAETIRDYLADDAARRRITEEAHRFVTTELTLERSFARLLALAAEGLDARGDAMKNVPTDYYERLHAVEERHWWRRGMLEITRALLARPARAAASSACSTPAAAPGAFSPGHPARARSTGSAASTSAPKRSSWHEPRFRASSSTWRRSTRFPSPTRHSTSSR